MSGDRVLILADDLTGANDTAIQFVKQGLSALVIIDSPPHTGIFENYDVISINTESRGMEGGEAYRVLRETLGRLGAAQKGCFVYKKTDSVLRGNPGEELAAVMDSLDIPLALAAPSFPANRAVLENGVLYSGGNTGSGGKDAVRIFAQGTGRKTENIPLDLVRRGAVFRAANDRPAIRACLPALCPCGSADPESPRPVRIPRRQPLG